VPGVSAVRNTRRGYDAGCSEACETQKEEKTICLSEIT